MAIITRTQYLNDSSNLHQAYYSQFVTPATVEYVKRRIGIEKLKSSKCEHFNDLGYKHSQGGAGTWIWDFAPVNIAAMIDAGECSGYGPSYSSITCTAKACARMILESNP